MDFFLKEPLPFVTALDPFVPRETGDAPARDLPPLSENRCISAPAFFATGAVTHASAESAAPLWAPKKLTFAIG